MRKLLFVLLGTLLLATTASVFAQQPDARGCQDHSLFTRMPGYWISSCKQVQFESHAFEVAQGKKSEVEGQFWEISYAPNSNLTSKPSPLQISRNFQNAAQKLGGKVVFSVKAGGWTKDTLSLTRDGKEFWVEVWAEFTGKHGLRIIQKNALAPLVPQKKNKGYRR